MTLSLKTSKEKEIHDQITMKLKKHFEDSVDLQKFNYFVRPLAETNMNSQDSFCLLTEIDKFIDSEHQCSLLILGDSGNGKSLLGQYVVWQLWKEYQPDKIIPIFIHLPLIPQTSRTQELLKSYLKLAGLKGEERTQLLEKNKLLVVLDGYDEIPEIGNLYKQNHWEKLKIKMITTCRPEAIFDRQTTSSYQELFLPKGIGTFTSQDRFAEFHLKKFNLEQIDKYLELYCKDHHLEDCDKKSLSSIPGLIELAATPFILSIVVRVLPRITKKYKNKELHEQRKLVRADLYDEFVDYWFDFQVERFREQGKLRSLNGDLKQYLKIYSQNLAYKALSQGKLEIAIEEHETLNPELLRPKDQNFFSQYTLDLPRLTEEAMKYIRSGCLLKTGQSYFSFLHKSLIEYFAAQDLFSGVHLSAELYTQEILQVESLNKFLGLNENLLMGEPEIIKILADRVKTDSRFKKLLYDVIEFSKRQTLIGIAASNAITILNVSGESFSNKDFSYIRIPKANLSGAICDQTDFSGADLNGVCFHDAWLKGSNFSHAQMSDVDFFELPGIENSSEISCFCIAPDGKFLLLGDIKGKLSKWCLASGEMEWKESCGSRGKRMKLASFIGFYPIMRIVISSDGGRAAVNAFDGVVHLWDLAKRKQISSFPKEDEEDVGDIFNIQFCPPDEKRLILCGGGANLQIWDIESKQCICSVDGTAGSIFSVRSNDKLLISYHSKSSSLSFYDLTTLSLQKIEITSQSDYCCFSSSTKYFGAILIQNQIQVLDLINCRNTKTFDLKGIKIKKVLFSPNEHLLVGMSDHKFYFWRIDSGRYLYGFVVPSPSSFQCLSWIEKTPLFSPNDSRCLFYPRDNKIDAWCIQTNPSPLTKCLFQPQTCDFQEGEKYFRREKNEGFKAFFFGPELLKINIHLSDDLKGYLEISRPEKTHKFRLKIKSKERKEFSFIFSLSRNHRYLALTVFADDLETEEISAFTAFSSISTKVVKLAERIFLDSDVRVFDLAKDQQIHTFSHSSQISYLRFSDDNEWLVTAGNAVRVWSLSSGKRLYKFHRHKGRVDAIALTSNKRFLVIADPARSIEIWDPSIQKSIFQIPQLPFNIHRMLFVKNENYLLCQTKERYQLLFKFHQDGEKAALNLYESSKNFNFNCFGVNLRGAYGLSSGNQRLLQQKGAIGKPSECSARPQSKNSLLLILKLNSDLQSAVKQRVFSVLSSKTPILYGSWVVSLLRKPQGKVPEHVFLLIEGVDQLGKGILGRIELVDNRERKGYALILEKCFHDIPANDLKSVFSKDIVEHSEVYSKSWSLPRSKVLLLMEDIEKDKEKEFKYAYLGDKSIFTKSSSVEGHNCFTWAREKLFNLDEDKIKRDLQEKKIDWIAANPNYYLLPNKKEKTEEEEKT